MCSPDSSTYAEQAAVLEAVEEPPFPGESVTLALNGVELRSLAAASMENQKAGVGAGSAMLYIPRANDDTGALLAVSQAGAGSDGTAQISATVVSRARVRETIDGIASASRYGDWPLWAGDARVRLAKAMLSAKDAAVELRQLRLRLGGEAEDEMWLRLTGVAPNQYDVELTPEEWMQTPTETRETWCRRAEWFSFALVRFSGDRERARRRDEAWGVTETEARVAIAVELMAVGRAEAVAKASIRNALGS